MWYKNKFSKGTGSASGVDEYVVKHHYTWKTPLFTFKLLALRYGSQVHPPSSDVSMSQITMLQT